ncbi:hypothetical protein GCM10007874_31100 [Labrys miyagiensis]|uniref:Uncharacterized protein n=1 Tax=Labrys miyagiensis TaxID=346912 RepID=A0ABQ6CK49_9HYPH|nr:hypothetical protein GCM10007874_31100 [Labrys miyagiensis]
MQSDGPNQKPAGTREAFLTHNMKHDCPHSPTGLSVEKIATRRPVNHSLTGNIFCVTSFLLPFETGLAFRLKRYQDHYEDEGYDSSIGTAIRIASALPRHGLPAPHEAMSELIPLSHAEGRPAGAQSTEAVPVPTDCGPMEATGFPFHGS